MNTKSKVLLTLASLLLVVAVIDARFNEALILGKYEMISDPRKEDYNRWLRAIKFDDATRSIIRGIKLQVHMLKGSAPNNYGSVLGNGVINVNFVFELGREFEERFPDTRPIRIIVTFEGNKIIANATLPNAKFVLKSEVSEDGLKAILVSKDVVAVVKFARLDCSFC